MDIHTFSAKNSRRFPS